MRRRRAGARKGVQGRARARIGTSRHGVVGLGHDPVTRPAWATTSMGHDTADPRLKACDSARVAWLVGGVAIQTLYRGWGGGGALCRDTARDTAAIRHPAPCDMEQGHCDTRCSARDTERQERGS